MAPKQARRPAAAGTDAETAPTQRTGGTRANASAPTRARRRSGPKKDPKRVERARLALALSGGNAEQAAKASGVPPQTIRRWIADGEFDQDAWEKVRDERKREAIELAYDGIKNHLEAIKDPGRVRIVTKAGEVLDLGIDHKASAQVLRAQAEVVRILGGGAAKIGEEGDQPVGRIEIVWPDYDAKGKVVPFRRGAASA